MKRNTATSPPLEPIIRNFGKHRSRNHFDCGIRGIDQWFKNQSARYVDRLEVQVFTCHDGMAERAIGFYALQIGSESMAEVENKPNDFTKNRTAFPAIHLAYLGVHGSQQGCGVGTMLLADVFDRAYEVSRHAGLYALTLQSVDHRSTKFYLKNGFQRYGGTDEHPKMLLPIRTIVELVESNRPD